MKGRKERRKEGRKERRRGVLLSKVCFSLEVARKREINEEMEGEGKKRRREREKERERDHLREREIR